ncbi:hypothetical protein BIW11_07894 [Tropilaelaps mercedesae]|uniref:Uncharacterized protein n=1 Tax=Tropilaelaps mercedesae TaxID=418985 RepID=A0A1V9XRZ7_9ACAR|nr:hypothetical protein BIW11_07894 [Tropilaelaps mercedesae]
MPRLRTQCRLREKVENFKTLRTSTGIAQSESKLTNHTEGRRRKSEATLVPEFTFTVSPEKTIVNDDDNEGPKDTTDTSKMRLRSRSFQKSDITPCKGSSPKSDRRRQHEPAPAENKTVYTGLTPSTNQVSIKNNRRKGANNSKNILEDLTNSSTPLVKKNTLKKASSNLSITKRNTRSRTADERSFIQTDRRSSPESFQGSIEDPRSSSLANAVSAPPAQFHKIGPDIITERRHDDCTVKETFPQHERDSDSNGVPALNRLQHDKLDVEINDNINEGTEFNSQEGVNFKQSAKTINHESSGSRPALSSIAKVAQAASGETSSTSELSVESREIRERVLTRLEDHSNDEQSLCNDPEGNSLNRGDAHFDALLQEHRATSSPQKGVSANEENGVSFPDLEEKIHETCQTEFTHSEDTLSDPRDQIFATAIRIHQVSNNKTIASDGADEPCNDKRPDDSLAARFELLKNNAQFKQPLPRHMVVHKQAPVSASPASFTSDEGAGNSDLQLFTGAAVSRALTMLEDSSHEVLLPGISREKAESSNDGSVDSDADIDVMIQSKCIGTSLQYSKLNNCCYRKVLQQTDLCRHDAATSISVLFGNSGKPSEEQDNNSLELILEDGSNQASADKRIGTVDKDHQLSIQKPMNNRTYDVVPQQKRNVTSVQIFGEEEQTLLVEVSCLEEPKNEQRSALSTAKFCGAGETFVCDIKPEAKQHEGVQPIAESKVVYGMTTFPSPVEDQPEEEVEPYFADCELEEARPSRKSKLESTRLLCTEEAPEVVFVIPDELDGELQPTMEVPSMMKGHEEYDNSSQRTRTNECRNAAVETGPSLFEAKVDETTLKNSEALPYHLSSSMALEGDNDAQLMHRDLSGQSIKVGDHRDVSIDEKHNFAKLNDASNAVTEISIRLQEDVSDEMQPRHVEAEIKPQQIKKLISSQVGQRYCDGSSIQNFNRVHERRCQETESELVSDLVGSAKSGEHGSDNGMNAVENLNKNRLTVDFSTTKETFSITCKSVLNDPLQEHGASNLLDLIPLGLVRMPFLGLDTTSQTISTPSGHLADDNYLHCLGPKATPSVVHVVPCGNGPITPTSARCSQRYRIGGNKPYLKDRRPIFSPLSVQENMDEECYIIGISAGRLRRRHLFRDGPDNADLLPEFDSLPPPADQRRRISGFALDSNRLPHFNDSYLEVGFSPTEIKKCGDQLLSMAVKNLVANKTGVSTCIRQALEDRVLPNHESSLKEIMTLLVRKGALREEFKRACATYQHQQGRLENARNFINATVDKLLLEGENDALKVLGYNPYDRQMPPPEFVRKSEIRRLQEAERLSIDKKQRMGF